MGDPSAILFYLRRPNFCCVGLQSFAGVWIVRKKLHFTDASLILEFGKRLVCKAPDSPSPILFATQCLLCQRLRARCKHKWTSSFMVSPQTSSLTSQNVAGRRGGRIWIADENRIFCCNILGVFPSLSLEWNGCARMKIYKSICHQESLNKCLEGLK